MSRPSFLWESSNTLAAHKFTCGYCMTFVSSNMGYVARLLGTSFTEKIYLCPGCRRPTYFSVEDKQFPAEPMGRPVDALPDGVRAIYTEARVAASAGAFTGCVLLCRTLLGHVAEEKGAPAGATFQQHIDFLVTAGTLPTSSKAWVDLIRQHGNRATHRLELGTRDTAFEMLTFSEMVLKLVYEFPSKLLPPPPDPSSKQGK